MKCVCEILTQGHLKDFNHHMTIVKQCFIVSCILLQHVPL